ncbi:RHS repeat domain-containing protein [Snodgrassella alvi]|uniref:RHS repeat domain-containing protein n=1 Tax=Snodgrassella alvi TaxID=1196083 RepID=UPI000CC70FD1|nr:RHS repeat-associated core domain-containing protein [Snodgrassella alvi]PIT15385.1 hypothetical protein BGI33_06210 [Snodgrassella alvi]PIT16941.1 hypothetical protein BGI34_09090 [Snodgrassella alvi]
MIQETGPNHPTSLYIYTDQNSYEPLARIDTDGNQEQHIRYFHTDLNGCPEELTDANGELLWECSFQLWGKRIHEIEHESVEQNLRYQGQYLDRETGLHYNTFRYYDPDIGRFTQPDPIGLLGGFNLYQYAPNGLTWIDPWGLNEKSIGTEDNPFSSSRAARRDAMRQVGIPTSQQPLSQSKNKSGREYTYRTPKKQGGGMTISSVQDQTMDSSHLEKPHWEAGQVKIDDSGRPIMNKYKRPQLKNGKGKAYYVKLMGICK